LKKPLEINLRRKLQCESYDLMMTVSKFEGQNELLAILKLFEEHGSVTQSIVNEELLSQPASSQYGQNVLSVVESYGLIRQGTRMGKYELTETGKDALEMNKIPFPNKGPFNILISHDPLLPYEILDIRDTDQTDFDGQSEKSLSGLPGEFLEILKKWSKKTLALSARNLETVIVVEFNPTGIKTRYKGDYGLSLQVRYGKKPELYFTGKSEIRIKSPNDLDSLDILNELLNKQGKLTVQQGEPVLLVGTAGLTMSDLGNFSKNYNISDPGLENYGTFEPVSVNNLRIFPSSLSEAKKWAWKLVFDGLDHYIGKRQYDELVEATCRKFEPYYNAQNLMSGMPDYERVIEMAKNGDAELRKSYWYLVAPIDLSPGRAPQ